MSLTNFCILLGEFEYDYRQRHRNAAMNVMSGAEVMCFNTQQQDASLPNLLVIGDDRLVLFVLSVWNVLV